MSPEKVDMRDALNIIRSIANTLFDIATQG